MYEFLEYKLPNSKKWLLTEAFLTTFKEELDRIFNVDEKFEKPTYWNTYNWLEGTGGFYSALKITSEKYNVTKAIYDYARNMPWYHSDLFDSYLTVMMYERGIINEGDIDEIYVYEETEEELAKMEKNGEIEWTEDVKRYNDGFVVKREWKYT